MPSVASGAKRGRAAPSEPHESLPSRTKRGRAGSDAAAATEQLEPAQEEPTQVGGLRRRSRHGSCGADAAPPPAAPPLQAAEEAPPDEPQAEEKPVERRRSARSEAKMTSMLISESPPPPPPDWEWPALDDVIQVEVTDSYGVTAWQRATVREVLVDGWFQAEIMVKGTLGGRKECWEDWFTWREEGVDWRRLPSAAAKKVEADPAAGARQRERPRAERGAGSKEREKPSGRRAGENGERGQGTAGTAASGTAAGGSEAPRRLRLRLDHSRRSSAMCSVVSHGVRAIRYGAVRYTRRPGAHYMRLHTSLHCVLYTLYIIKYR